MKTYKFKLYNHKRNRYLKRTINAAASIYNHCLALHKRYYRMCGKHLNKFQLMKHLAKLRNKNSYWQRVGSQAVQDICDRIDRSYKLFFKHHSKGVKPPSFCQSKKYKSFTLKQAGYQLIGNKIRIGKQTFGYYKSRVIEGKIKTLTVKRVPSGDMYIFIVTDAVSESIGVVTGKIAGFDFGLKTFLTNSNGKDIESPLFLLQAKKQLKKLSQQLSSKKLGSNNWNKARINLAKLHERVTNLRRDWFWKLSHKLCDEYDVLCFETLNLRGMQKLWGRKIGDLAFGTFLEILQTVAAMKGKQVVSIGQWFASSKLCSNCSHKHSGLQLRDREWTCLNCGTHHDRDKNAAINIQREGVSSLRLDTVRLPKEASVA
ncbi:transposase [Tychonema sp. LEGE 07199]|uniref:RNA-guided endonuclease InsQ/TnpB family protein n=1 Tax=unclassified Tychonema TaxID=2642144 RepID=UPI0018810F66|nr:MULTISPECIES: RNA-guided endonuclease TnpB family protein [unclassified Tychonema]MBE9120990.1 transposase [Tychonema sp. LEGE 07199]MBE9131119.1 transposase [Tychonema sp. LEGE 07196]